MNAPVLEGLNLLLQHAWAHNPFYQTIWKRAGLGPSPLGSVEELRRYPPVSRADFHEDQQQNPPLGSNRSAPLADFVRAYHSSGSTGSPIYWGDTRESLAWAQQCSRELFRISGVTDDDRVLLFLTFGAFSGPSLISRGAEALGIPCYFASSTSLAEGAEMLERFRPTVLIGRPYRTIELGRLLQGRGMDLRNSGIRKVICSGASCDDSTREILRTEWGAEPLSRYGLTEAGSVAAECAMNPGTLHVLDQQFVVECLDPACDEAALRDEPGELVLTTLGRKDKPAIRYRTGDLVHLRENFSCRCGRHGSVIAGAIRRKPSGVAPRRV